jgi:hypothetical protein
MITDKQVLAAIAVFYKSGIGDGGIRKALEAYEQRKWAKFEKDDKTTPPKQGQQVATIAFGRFFTA